MLVVARFRGGGLRSPELTVRARTRPGVPATFIPRSQC